MKPGFRRSFAVICGLMASVCSGLAVSETEDIIDFSILFDKRVEYEGPSAAFASITGSPLWAFSYDQIIAKTVEYGWSVEFDSRVNTPYGIGPRVVQYRTESGRKVIWIPDYGWTLGQDDQLRQHQETLYWILWKAGVKLLVAGGNSGSSDWRVGPEAVKTGDLVFVWSFRTLNRYKGLPGTKYEAVFGSPSVRSRELDQPFMGAPFSKRLADIFAESAGPYVKKGLLRKIHPQDSVRIAIVHPESITFETDFDILFWQTISRQISEYSPDKPPVVMIHGDSINPILARYLKIEMLYYHVVSNIAQGLSTGEERIENKKKVIYSIPHAEMCLDLELSLLENVELINE